MTTLTCNITSEGGMFSSISSCLNQTNCTEAPPTPAPPPPTPPLTPPPTNTTPPSSERLTPRDAPTDEVA
jgi:hypothetical protein